MDQLTPEEVALLDILIEEKLAREDVPTPNRTIVRRFEKYAFPIGVDDAGNPFPIPRPHPDEDRREAG